MHTSFPLSRIIKKFWWSFALATILVPITSVFLIRVKTAPKDFEKYSLFIGADVSNQEDLETEINELLPEDKEVTVYYASEHDSLFGTLYQGYSQYSDVLMLSKTKLETFTDFSLFINVNSLNNVDTSSGYKEYGLYLDINSENLLTKYTKFLDCDYYVLLNKNSVHLQGLMNEGKTNQTSRLLSEIGLYRREE